MPVYTRSTLVPASAEDLYRFHENPHNLRRISPPGLTILEIRADEIARPGAEFTLVVRQAPFTLHWAGRWEAVQPSVLLIDTGVRCPFVFWRHHHIFEPQGSACRMTDRVEFRLPWRLGGPVGDMVCRHLVFPRMFAARHAATRAWFDSFHG